MARTNSKSQLETLRQQQLALISKIKEAEAKEKKKQHEDDQRRHILVGRIVLDYLDERDTFGEFDQTLLVLIERAMTRPADRKLFASLFGKLVNAAAASLKPTVEEPQPPAAPIVQPRPAAPAPPPVVRPASQTPAPEMPHIDLASLLGR